MAHITLSQLTTVLQRIVSWATGKFAAKNTYSGKIEYADMPVVVLASMGSELDGTSAQRPMSTGSTYYLPAGQGAGARIMFVDSNGTAVKISNPGSNVIYCNAYTGLLYRWDASESDMVPVGGDLDGLRKVYVDNMDFSSLDTLYSGVYQVIDQTTQRIIGVLVASSDNRFGENPYFVTQWLFSNLLLSDEYSGSFNGYYTIGRAHIIHRFYNASNTSSDIPLNTWSEWKVYGLTFDEMSEIFNSKVSTISVNGTNHTPNSSGVVNLGTVITAHQDISGKANASDVYTKTQTDTLLSGKLSKSDVSIETQGDGTVDINVGSGANKDTYTINLNHTHENMAKLVVCEESDLPSTLDMDTIYAQVDDAETPTEIQSLWIAGLEFVGGGGASDDTPRLIAPRDGLTLDFDGQSTIQLAVRGKNLLSDLSLTVTGDFTVTDGNNAAVSTITATAANNGVVLRLTKGSNYNNGTLRIFSSEVGVTVTLKRDISLPAGYSPLEAVSPNSTILSLADTNISVYSSWRIVASSSSGTTAQILICPKSTAAGRYFGITKDNKWGVATDYTIDGLSITDKTEALVEFGNSLTRLTIGGNSITASPEQSAGSSLELFGCSVGNPFYFPGNVYEIECVSGGSFHAFPAKRLSDNAVGLYDIENDVFYTGFSS